ncbi:hypothetical protein EDD22DRAFT_781494, partial [Suillus occidentalis]
FLNKFVYFWTRSEHAWTLSAIPDPNPNNKLKAGSATDKNEALQYAIKAYSHLITRGLPCNAPPVVVDFEEL